MKENPDDLYLIPTAVVWIYWSKTSNLGFNHKNEDAVEKFFNKGLEDTSDGVLLYSTAKPKRIYVNNVAIIDNSNMDKMSDHIKHLYTLQGGKVSIHSYLLTYLALHARLFNNEDIELEDYFNVTKTRRARDAGDSSGRSDTSRNFISFWTETMPEGVFNLHEKYLNFTYPMKYEHAPSGYGDKNRAYHGKGVMGTQGEEPEKKRDYSMRDAYYAKLGIF